MNVCHVDAWGREWQLSPEQHRSLHQFRRTKPFWHWQNRVLLFHLPVLGSPFYGRQDLWGIHMGTGTKHYQASDRWVILSEGVGDELGTPADVLMRASSHLLFQLHICRVFLGAGHHFANALLVPDNKLLVTLVGSLALTVHLIFSTLQACSTFAMYLASAAYLTLTTHLTLSLGFLALTSVSFLHSSLLLVREQPCSCSSALLSPAADVRRCSQEGASSRSGWGGVLALFLWLFSNGDG